VGRYRFIAAEKANWSVRLMCRVLGVARSAYHDWEREGERRIVRNNLRLLVHIRAIYRRSLETYGSPRITAELRAEGWRVGRHRVARLMRKHGLAGIPKKRFKGSTTDSDHENAVAPNLLNRKFHVESENKVWVGDITYLRTDEGWVYLAVLIDLRSRKVVGWAVDNHMRTSLISNALQMAIRLRSPLPGLIHHSDRGSQYTSSEYGAELEKIGAKASMSRKGNCWDNAVAESFFGTLEQELASRKKWRNLREARAAVGSYIHEFYNTQRRHSKLGYLAPAEFERTKELAA